MFFCDIPNKVQTRLQTKAKKNTMLRLSYQPLCLMNAVTSIQGLELDPNKVLSGEGAAITRGQYNGL